MEIRIGSGPPPARYHLGWPWLVPPLTLAIAMLVALLTTIPW